MRHASFRTSRLTSMVFFSMRTSVYHRSAVSLIGDRGTVEEFCRNAPKNDTQIEERDKRLFLIGQPRSTNESFFMISRALVLDILFGLLVSLNGRARGPVQCNLRIWHDSSRAMQLPRILL
jgi:hypothetical protein